MVKITSFQAENVKRIRMVQFVPTESGLTIIGGDNRNGKTSVLDSIAWTLGGAKFAPSNPQNADSVNPPGTKITLSNGLTVERHGKNSSLKVSDPEGKKAGQELLNEFISAFALDLPRFMNSSDKDKAFILLDVLGIKDKLTELENKEKALYDERTEVGRVAESKKKHADELAYYHDAPGAEISASTVIARQQEAVTANNCNAEKRRKLEELTYRIAGNHQQLHEFDNATGNLDKKRLSVIEEVADIEKKIEGRSNHPVDPELHENFRNLQNRMYKIADDLAGYHDFSEFKHHIIQAGACLMKMFEERERSIGELKNYLIQKQNETGKIGFEIDLRLKKRVEMLSQTKSIEAGRDALADEVAKLPADIDLEIFTADIEKLEAENAKYRGNVEQGKAAAEAKAQQDRYDGLTAEVEQVRRDIMALLDSVKMPLPGLTVKNAILYYNGQKWDCMSGAEQLIVATSIVKALNPQCGFVLMDKLEAMDLATLEKFNEWLMAEDLQVIATRVSKGDECSIIIEDGEASLR